MMMKRDGRKPPPAPSQSAYMHFSRAQRAAVAAAHVDWSVQQVSAELGRLWRALAAVERRPWVELAQFDRARFHRELMAVQHERMDGQQEESVRVVQERTTVAKRERRVGEPRQPDTAYTFFWKSRRKQVMEESPHLSGPLVSREVGRLWKSLGVEDRKVWDDMAEKDKVRFQQEMAEYVPPPPEDEAAAVLAKPIKDPYAPKPARTGFQLFMNHNRESFALVHMSLNEFRAEMGQLWKRMSDKDKAVWLEMARQDQARFETERKAYKPPAYLSTTAVRATRSLDELKKLAKSDPQAPRLPTSAYSFFLSSNKRQDIQQQQPGLKHNQLMREIGIAWKALSDSARQPFIAQADEDSDRFKNEMELYLINNQKDALGLGVTKKGVKRGRPKSDEALHIVSPPSKSTKQGKLAPPRRPQTAYNLMYMSKRAEVMATYQISHNECSALCGRLWRQMSNAEREPFKRMANEEKRRYATELKEYRAKVEGQTISNPAKQATGYQCFAETKRRECGRSTPHDVSTIWSSMPEPYQIAWAELSEDNEQPSASSLRQQPADEEAEAEQRQLEENACAILAARELRISVGETNTADPPYQNKMVRHEANKDTAASHYTSLAYSPSDDSDDTIRHLDERNHRYSSHSSTSSRGMNVGFAVFVAMQKSHRADWTQSMWLSEWNSLPENHRRHWERLAREQRDNRDDNRVDRLRSRPDNQRMRSDSDDSSVVSHSDDDEWNRNGRHSSIDDNSIISELVPPNAGTMEEPTTVEFV